MLMRRNFHLFGKLPYFKKFYDEIKKNKEDLYSFYDRHIHEHKAKIDFNHNAEPSDFCEAYLREMHKLEGQEGHFFS